LQVRWGGIDDERILPARQNFHAAERQRDPLHGHHRQIEMKVNPFLMLESDLFAVTSTAVLVVCFRFAMPVRITAAVRRPEREVLLARYAAAPHQRQDEK
jgi:hypothetical protein